MKSIHSYAASCAVLLAVAGCSDAGDDPALATSSTQAASGSGGLPQGMGGAGGGPSGGGESPAQAGDVVISELMGLPVPPASPADEWVEIHNPSGTAFNLYGCTLSDDTPGAPESVTIDDDVLVAAGGFVVLTRTASPQGIASAYAYGDGFTLNEDGPDELFLACGGVTIDQVVYNLAGVGPGIIPGESSQIDGCIFAAGDLAAVNDEAASWCEDPGVPGEEIGTQYYLEPNSGTPGGANVNCSGGADGGQTACP